MFDDIALPIIRDTIIGGLKTTGALVRCHVDETVWPNKGELFIGVYPSSIAGPPINSEEATDFICGFTVGFTVRCGQTPEDRLFDHAYGAKGLVPLVREVLSIIRRERWTIQTAINAVLDTPQDSFTYANWKLVEPYRFQGGDLLVTKKGPEHFHAEQINETRQYYGLFTSATWSEGRYMASLLNEEAVF